GHAPQVLVRRELRVREIAALQMQVGAGRDSDERFVHDAVAAEREDLALGLDAKAETDPARTKALVERQTVAVLHLFAGHAVLGCFHDWTCAYFGHARPDERAHCGLAFGTKPHVELIHAADEKVDYLGSPGRTEHGDRLPAARHPARDQTVRELADVVDMQMRDEERAERGDRESLLSDALDCAAPDIQQEASVADFEHRPGRAAIRIRPRSAGAECVELH